MPHLPPAQNLILVKQTCSITPLWKEPKLPFAPASLEQCPIGVHIKRCLISKLVKNAFLKTKYPNPIPSFMTLKKCSERLSRFQVFSNNLKIKSSDTISSLLTSLLGLKLLRIQARHQVYKSKCNNMREQLGQTKKLTHNEMKAYNPRSRGETL